MGQTQTNSRSPKQTSTISNLPNEDMDLDQSIMGFAEDRDSETCCATIGLNKISKQKKEPEWKSFLFRRLDKMASEEWPQVLLNILRDDRKATDPRYYTDVMKACYKEMVISTYKQKLERKTLDANTNYSDSPKTAKFSDQDDGSPIKLYDISDEKHYFLHREPSWMEKTYNIKAKEDREAMMASITYLADVRNASDPFDGAANENRTSLKKKLGTVYKSQYDNYTVLSPGLGESPCSKQNEDSVHKYKAVVKVIEEHLKNEDNIFCKLIKAFEVYYEKRYKEILEKFNAKAISTADMKQHIIRATLDLQQFIGTLYEALTLYYKLEKIKNDPRTFWRELLNRDNVINFITSVILTERVYNTIFNLYSTEDSDIQSLYQKNLKQCEGFRPEDFGVPDEYCLNEKTIAYLKKKGKLSENDGENMKRLSFHMSMVEEGIKAEEGKHDESSKTSCFAGLPYGKAIAALAEMKSRRSPIHKLKNILRVAELISISIEEFYETFGVVNKKRLDADQTLSLFLYLVSKSKLNNVSVHYKIIEKFTTNNILNSTSGYYATTMGACVACICSMDLRPEADVVECSTSIKKFIKSSRVGSFAQRASLASNPRLSM